jgi:signal transduction histidine kinase
VGLYAARGLMEAMGGSVAIDSQVGAGTTVTLRVPAESSVAGED